MLIFAHIAGIPVEETALSFGPVFAAAGSVTALRIRERVRGGRRRAAYRHQHRAGASRRDG
jgi:hypothetical protein